jgi:hypothetical protein
VDALEAVLLAAAAAGAGAVNAVAGGGSLISFPALVAAGYSAKVANVTNAVALLPGYAGGTYGYRAELRGQGRRVAWLAAPSIAGAAAGAVILLATPEDAFEAIVPFLILFACAVLAAQRPLAVWATRHRLGARHEQHIPLVLPVIVFGLGVYGAYFGAGLGIMTLAALGILLPGDLQSLNALKGVLSLLVNAVAVAWFALFGPVAWGAAAVMAAAALAGGYFGVDAARRLPARWLRATVIGYGAAAAAVLLVAGR